MTDLSPAAQVVLDTFLAEWADCFLEQDRRCLAAALLTLADQVVPEKSEPVTPDYPDSNQIEPFIEWLANKKIRDAILAIAGELRGQ